MFVFPYHGLPTNSVCRARGVPLSCFTRAIDVDMHPRLHQRRSVCFPTCHNATTLSGEKRIMAPNGVDPDTILSNMLEQVFSNERHFSKYVQVYEMFGQEKFFRLFKKLAAIW